MTNHSTTPSLQQSEIETVGHLFANWFDPIEAGLPAMPVPHSDLFGCDAAACTGGLHAGDRVPDLRIRHRAGDVYRASQMASAERMLKNIIEKDGFGRLPITANPMRSTHSVFAYDTNCSVVGYHMKDFERVKTV